MQPFLERTGLADIPNPIVPGTNLLATFYRPFGWLGNPLDRERGASRGVARNDAFRFSGGFAYDISDTLTADVSATYWRFERDFFLQDIVGSRLQNALGGLGGPNCNPATGTPGEGGCMFFNPFITASPENPALDLENPFFCSGY